MRKKLKFHQVFIIILIVFVLLVFSPSFFHKKSTQTNTITYHHMIQIIKKDASSGSPLSLVENQNGILILSDHGKTYTSQTTPPTNNQGKNSVASLTQNYNLTYRYENTGNVFSNIISLLSILVFIFFAVFIYSAFRTQKSGGKMFSNIMGNFTKKTEIPTLTFHDIGGLSPELISECRQVINIFRNKKLAKNFGVQPAKGILFFGPPGTGKTMLAKAFANDLNASFYSVSGSDFVEMFVGVGAKRVRELFEEARKNSPSVIFIDEVDAVGGKRADGAFRNKEVENTLNQILVELDGTNDNTNILVIFATNRPDTLDEALLRPGRIDHQIMIPLPDLEGRKEIIQIHAKDKPLSDTVRNRLDEIADNTYGYSGAQIAALFKHAANRAIGEERNEILMSDIHFSIDRVLLGNENRRIQNESTKKRVAYHEAGHALITALLRPSSIRKATIVPRGMAMGFVSQKPDESELSTEDDLYAQLQIMVAGGVAERVIFGKHSEGVYGDLSQVRSVVERMVDLGMVDDPFTITFNKKEKEKLMKNIYKTALSKCISLIKDNIDKLEKVAQSLLEKETLEGFEIEQLVK